MSPEIQDKKLVLTFCFGTSCFVRGAKALYAGLRDYVKNRGIDDETEFAVTFCTERCERGPILSVGGTVIERCTLVMAAEEIERQRSARRISE